MAKIFFRLVFGGIVGKLLGIGREVLLAALFGAGRVVAANRIALTATLLPINFFTADALTAGFLPLYIEYRKDRPDAARALYRTVRKILLVFSLGLAAALFAGSTIWVELLGPGLDRSTSGIAASMLQIAALGIPFYVQFHLYSLVGLAHDDVRLINLRPSFQSVGLICGTLVAYWTGQLSMLAWGFTIPYVVLCFWGAHRLRRQRYIPSAATPDTQQSVISAKEVLGPFWKRLRPLLLIPVILQGSIAVERAIGSLIGIEVVAATEYARYIVDSCMVLIAAPLGLASLASFAKVPAGEVGAKLRKLTLPLLLLMIPMSLALALNSEQIVTLIYGRGQFDAQAVHVSSVMLLGFAIGIWAQVLAYTYVKVLNARGANARVALVTALSFGAAIAINLLLYRQWGAFTIGAASTACGIIMFLAAALALKQLRFCVFWLLRLAPGAAAAGLAGYLTAGSSLGRMIVSCAAIAAVWVLYVAIFAQARQLMADVLRKILRRPKSGDGEIKAEEAVQAPGQGRSHLEPAGKGD
jgi:putative peptidoglycan lipid II flippase